jgi:hypothetical protein
VHEICQPQLIIARKIEELYVENKEIFTRAQWTWKAKRSMALLLLDFHALSLTKHIFSGSHDLSSSQHL